MGEAKDVGLGEWMGLTQDVSAKIREVGDGFYAMLVWKHVVGTRSGVEIREDPLELLGPFDSWGDACDEAGLRLRIWTEFGDGRVRNLGVVEGQDGEEA